MEMPALETPRLLVRPFQSGDLHVIHQTLDVELAGASDEPQSLDARRRWLEWSVLNYTELANLHQPPMGDRAIVLKASGELIGACGYNPALGPYELLPGWQAGAAPIPGMAPENCRNSLEVGMYWAISPSHQRRGYAGEAARALVEYAFDQLNLKRIVATTTFDNHASMGVMRKIDMRILKNPFPEPAWFQVVGVLDAGEQL